MQKTPVSLLKEFLKIVIISLILVVPVFAAWQEPTDAPPDGNVSAPVNVSGNTQMFTDSKKLKMKNDGGTGVLSLWGGLGVSGVLKGGPAVFDGPFIIGEGITDTMLTVTGRTKLSSPGNNVGLLYFPMGGIGGLEKGLYIRSDDEPYSYEPSSERLFIGGEPGNAKVGIGTVDPKYSLDVETNSSDTRVQLSNSKAGGISWNLISSANGSLNPEGTFGIQSDKNIGPGGQDTRFLITKDGDVLMGTTDNPGGDDLLVYNPKDHGTIGISGAGDGASSSGLFSNGVTSSALLLHDENPDFANSWIFAHRRDGEKRGDLWIGQETRRATVADILIDGPTGNVGIGNTDGIAPHKLTVNGSFSATSKLFNIEHPLDPDKRLVHGSLEGPEHAVFYRGDAQLRNGESVIELPTYFEALTRQENRTVLLTMIDGFDEIAVKTQDGRQIKDGKFTVYSNDKNSSQKFNWEVKAVRSDVEILKSEVNKEESR